MHDEMGDMSKGAISDDAMQETPTHGGALNDDILRDDMLRSAASRLREPVVASAGFDDWIMAEIRSGEAASAMANSSVRVRTRSWVSRHLEWLATGALLAVAAVTIVILRMTVQVPVVPAQGAQAATASTINNPGARIPHTPRVRFAFSAPDAHSVTVVGTFNGWDTRATPLRRDGGGVWSVNIPLEAGRYAYMFVVDGKRWVLDPSAARDASDDFGTPNSVVMVASAVRE